MYYVDHLGVKILIFLHLCIMIGSREVSESILCTMPPFVDLLTQGMNLTPLVSIPIGKYVI